MLTARFTVRVGANAVDSIVHDTQRLENSIGIGRGST
jgi:hypothetical protein